MNKAITLQVICPHCRQSLMEEKIKIKGLASVHLSVSTEGGEKGDTYLCSAYECYDHHTDVKVDEGEITALCCPHCGRELLTKETCQVCGAPMAELGLDGGGFIRICSRKGCFNHFLSNNDEE